MGKSIEKSKEKSSPVISPARHTQQPVGLYSRYIQMKEDNTPLIRRRNASDYNTYVNPKMDVVDPEDSSEKEADATADQVISSPESSSDEEKVQAKPLAGSINRKGQSGKSGVAVSGNTASYVDGLSGGQPLSRQEKSFYEPRFGADFSNVRVHNDSKAHDAAQSINAKAFTRGNNIVFGKGQYSPNSSDGKHLMAHELTHTVQKNQGISRKTIMRDAAEQDYAEIGIWVNCYLRDEPNGNRMEEHLLGTGEKVQMIDRTGTWLKVKSSSGTMGWLRMGWTNMAQHTDPGVENLKCQQDIDNFLDAHVIPAFNTWERSLRIQGDAYFNAYTSFQDTLVNAEQEAKLRADIFAAILTTVSVGSLGFLGDIASTGMDWSRILKSEAVRGALEDAIQTGIGETIDISQGNWYSRHINTETHPLRYLNSQLGSLTTIRSTLTSNLANIKLDIARSPNLVDRVNVLLNMYQWWNGAKLRHTPQITESQKSAFQREIERGFWQRYILNNLSEGVYYLFWGPGYKYENAESAVKNRLDHLRISGMAGIEEWEAWYERINDSGREANGEYYSGPDDTQKLAAWARNYQLRTFY